MKFLKFILILILMYSCGTGKFMMKKPHFSPKVDSVATKTDSISHANSEGDGVPDIIDDDTTVLSHVEGAAPKPTMTTTYAYTNVSENSISTLQTIATSHGLIAYAVPKDMVVGNRYIIKVRISKEKNETQLIVGDRRVAIGDTNTSIISVEPIRVEPVMSAQIFSEDGKFEIDTLSTSVQNIEENGYTEWAWGIKPIKGGEGSLRLIVKVRIKTEQGIFYKDITVFDKNVKVKSNIVFSIKRWISNYWQWLITSIISPLVVWFYKRRKEKKDEKKKKGRK